MPKLPKYGWLFHCEDCDTITSRLTVVKHRRKTKKVPVCIKCRPNFIFLLLKEFKFVVIDNETTAEQRVIVSDAL